MITSIFKKIKDRNGLLRIYNSRNINDSVSPKFQTVFSLPLIKYISVINRLKMYHFLGTSIAVPGCGVLEMMNCITEQSFMTASYIGLTGGLVLSIFTYPFRNIIGFLYISDDDQHIKISSVDFWGIRKDRIIPTENWIPLLEIPPKTMDAIYLTPKLTDGTEYKLLVKFGKILDQKRMGQVLE
ncbi:hypothetical protein K1T71_007213 [Dendrolimus kikuchii]|uniref:Uncharacterized protein n=1 Tax=Dendrolimus kikuchii TaxID=765133 RepID=A0ACC1D0F8_9NEOP|nr:hypothetical protein K1T71_007213 [Dendrolimus kikuchii]